MSTRTFGVADDAAIEVYRLRANVQAIFVIGPEPYLLILEYARQDVLLAIDCSELPRRCAFACTLRRWHGLGDGNDVATQLRSPVSVAWRSRVQLRELLVLFAVGWALTLAVFFLALFLLPFETLTPFPFPRFPGDSDFGLRWRRASLKKLRQTDVRPKIET